MAAMRSVKVNPARVDAVRARAFEAIDDGQIPSCQFALALDGEVIVNETLGDAPADARYLMMSSTKPVFASVVLQLIGGGRLDPALPVVTWWPEFGAHGKEAITLEQVMTFTCGLPSRTVEHGSDRAARQTQIEAWTLEYEPGTQFRYHGLSAHWILAELVARVTGQDHRQALRERILDPLGLDRLEVGMPADRQHDVQRIVARGELPSTEEFRAALKEWLGIDLPEGFALPSAGGATSLPANQADDLFGYLQSPAGMEAGVPGGGDVSDAASVALFYQALLSNQKDLWDSMVLEDAKTNIRNMLPDEFGRPAARSIGFEIAIDDPSQTRTGSRGRPGMFGHPGAMGQLAWADPATGLSFAFLTNGADRNFVRQYSRDFALQPLAAASVDD